MWKDHSAKSELFVVMTQGRDKIQPHSFYSSECKADHVRDFLRATGEFRHVWVVKPKAYNSLKLVLFKEYDINRFVPAALLSDDTPMDKINSIMKDKGASITVKARFDTKSPLTPDGEIKVDSIEVAKWDLLMPWEKYVCQGVKAHGNIYTIYHSFTNLHDTEPVQKYFIHDVYEFVLPMLGQTWETSKPVWRIQWNSSHGVTVGSEPSIMARLVTLDHVYGDRGRGAHMWVVGDESVIDPAKDALLKFLNLSLNQPKTSHHGHTFWIGGQYCGQITDFLSYRQGTIYRNSVTIKTPANLRHAQLGLIEGKKRCQANIVGSYKAWNCGEILIDDVIDHGEAMSINFVNRHDMSEWGVD